jgi:Tfp pilus assembly protein PilF
VENYGLLNKGDVDRALADLNEAIRLDPKDSDAVHMRGWAWEKRMISIGP